MTAFRIAAVYVLVTVLLACPYICLAHVATQRGPVLTRSQRPACCDCCSRAASQDSPQCPTKPDSRPTSGSCLCHGAVMDRQVELPGVEQAVVAFLPADAMLVLGKRPVGDGSFWSFWTEHTACHFAAAKTGRELRALIASFLL